MLQMEVDASVSPDGFDRWLTATLGAHRPPELVADHPWAKTFRVRAGQQTFFAKLLPASQREALAAMPVLAECFPHSVPGVAAVDPELGAILLQDHGGEEWGTTDEPERLAKLLATYASIQAQAARTPGLLGRLPRFDADGLVERFIEYFRPLYSGRGAVGAAHFIGEDEAARYFEQLRLRREPLEALVETAQALPLTINHCDLRTKNVAEKADGSVVIFDWDEAVAGPAGMSLHNFFSGCSAIADVLYGSADASPLVGKHDSLLKMYIETLAAGQYADRAQIEDAIVGSACMGVMRYLLSYGKFPMESAENRKVIAKIICRRSDDLLKLADRMAACDRQCSLRLIDDYEQRGNGRAAQRLLANYLSLHPADADARVSLAEKLAASDKPQEAEMVLRAGLASDPTCAALRFALGEMLLERLELEAAVDQLQLAATFAPKNAEIRKRFEEGLLLQATLRDASAVGQVPRLRFTEEEIRTGVMSPCKRQMAARLFREYGTLLIENVFSADLLERLHAEFSERYEKYFADSRPGDALRVGDRRFMITVDIAGPFNDPALYAPALLTPVLLRLLGDAYILGSFTAVASLPGAQDMRMHKDHPALFDDQCASTLPTFAVTTLIPLRGFDRAMGTTRVVKKSHRYSSAESAEMEYQDPYGPVGSCLLMDYRLSHQGLANRSPSIRPVLSLVYSRPWVRDSVNYKLQDPLKMSREEFARVGQDQQHLFACLPSR
ncbi:MAG: phytanoyl-CoA dioxygenase family protein [Aureliella sp.]